MESTGWSTEYV